MLVEIKRVGRNYLPFVENIRSRVIKYIDFCPAAYLPETSAAGLQSTTNMYFTIFNEYGTEELHREMPLERFDFAQTLGTRIPIFSKISLQNTFIDCQDANQVGKVAALLFWYDLPNYSARNSAERVTTDSIVVPITTATRYNALPDTDRLTGKRFRRILLGMPSVMPDYQTGLSQSELANCYLTLRKGTYNVLENCPLAVLYQLQMLEKTEFANIIFDFQNSYITIGGAGTIPNVQTDYVGKSVFLNLQYEAK